MKVIFLDIDGVLTTPRTGYRYGNPPCVERLNRLTDRTGAALVLSSTWRVNADVDGRLREWGVTDRIIGKTPVLPEQVNGVWRIVQRGDEIQKWLDEWLAVEGNPRIESFVILDDNADMGALLDRLVLTDGGEGLQDEDLEKAMGLLSFHAPPSGSFG